MKRPLIWYITIYFSVTVVFWLAMHIYDELYFVETITRPSGLIDEPAMIASLIAWLKPFVIIRFAIFALIPLLVPAMRATWQRLIGTWLILLLMTLLADLITAVFVVPIISLSFRWIGTWLFL